MITAGCPPTFLDEMPGEHLPLEVIGAPSTPTSEAGDEAPKEDSGSSWLRPGFEMPTEEEVLRELATEITNRTPPLRNIRFTNWYVASFIGGAILNRAADVKSLVSMGEMGVDEATNRVGALLARVSRLSFSTFFFLFFLTFFFHVSSQVASYVLYIANSRSVEAEERAAADVEWRAANEPHLTDLEVTVADQAARLELAASEKLKMESEAADLRVRLLKAEERAAELEAANSALNTARDKAIAGPISVQERVELL